MLDIILTASVSFIICFLAIPVVLQVAETKKLYDIPDERKVHTRPVASLGGVGIFAGFMMASLLSVDGYLNPEFQSYFAAALVIFFLGLKDDLVILSASKKFIGQLIAASILIHIGKLKIVSMYGIFGFYELPEAFSLALTYLTIIVVINSFNLIDGIDGLAASLGILTMLVFGSYFFAIHEQAYAILAFSMAGALVAFLIFNHHPARIFMGDSGSLMIGMINSILVIKFISTAHDPLVSIPVPSAVAIGITVLIVPLLDTLRVFSTRIFRGRSPFTPDRNHVHHLLLDRGFSHPVITLMLVGINILFVVMAFALRSIGPNYVLMIILTLSFSGLAVLYYYRRPLRGRMVIAKRSDGSSSLLKRGSRVVPLTTESQVADKN